MSTAVASSVRRRLACDRCHSFKLKCPRPAPSPNGVCARCLKAGAACVYSPSMRGQVRAKASSGNRTMLGDSTIEAGFDGSVPPIDEGNLFSDIMTMDWSAYNPTSIDEGLDWISQLPSQTEPLDTLAVAGQTGPQFRSNRPSTDRDGPNPHHSETANPQSRVDEQIQIVPNERTQRPKASPQYLGFPMPESMQSPSLFLDLINLSMHLENLSRGFAPFSVHETTDNDGLAAEDTLPTSQATSQATAKPCPSNVPSSAANRESPDSDETGNIFAVMHKLVDLYRAVLKHLGQRQAIHNETVDPEGQHISTTDASLVYLLFSNHHRLIDIWHCIFAHSRTVLRTDKIPPRSEQHKTHCAKMRLGSYLPSSSSRIVPMEIIVVQELAVHLTRALGELKQVIDIDSDVQSDSTERTGKHDSAIISAAADLEQRMVGLQTAIRQLREKLEEAITKQAAITKQW